MSPANNNETPLPQEVPKQTIVPTQPNDGMQVLIPTKNKPALISYYFGVFGLIPLLGLPCSVVALILGQKGLKQYKANPTPGAKAHALIGLWLGIFELVVFAGFITFVIIVKKQLYN